MSVNQKSIEDFLKDRKIKYVSSFSYIEDEDTLIINIPIELLTSGATSSRKIKNLTSSLSNHFQTQVIESIIQSEKSKTINFGISAIINEDIPSSEYDLSLIIQSDDTLNVFLKLKNQIEIGSLEKIKTNIEKYFDILKIDNFKLEIIKTPESLPSLTAILRSGKKISPFSVNELITELISHDFHLPSEKWIRNQLDSIRKKGLIFRRSDERYTLTYQGVLATPSTGNRNSSDIERVLYMARKKW